MADKKKTVEELVFLDLYYHPEHTWVRVEGDIVLAGITDFAQDQLGDIVFLELPSVGDTFAKDDVFGQAESTKSVSALYMPISGEVFAVNDNAEESPDLVNKDCYGEGWMLKVKPRDLEELKELLSREEYLDLLKES
ncbi:glycine cleavage system h-protein [Lucifera butyrica]|uniref:Glycine cleavage system H protein n=1 Tax=Lucifera butyrica TaxID=1351585 RepID=A0A498R195_9FIRM|nr:glycine cleavage system protein GcvH [Lucifera butyrica]VBB04925.1 glycine cleavage system h-protein [Lucifera butyrica]